MAITSNKAINAIDPNQMIWREFGFSTKLLEYPTKKLIIGQLIFYLPGSSSIPSQITLMHGGDDATNRKFAKLAVLGQGRPFLCQYFLNTIQIFKK